MPEAFGDPGEEAVQGDGRLLFRLEARVDARDLGELGDLLSAARTLQNLGLIARERGDDEAAEALYHQALAMLRKVLKSNLPLGTIGDVVSFALPLPLELKQHLLGNCADPAALISTWQKETEWAQVQKPL